MATVVDYNDFIGIVWGILRIVTIGPTRSKDIDIFCFTPKKLIDYLLLDIAGEQFRKWVRFIAYTLRMLATPVTGFPNGNRVHRVLSNKNTSF